jgi:hypothetical protein
MLETEAWEGLSTLGRTSPVSSRPEIELLPADDSFICCYVETPVDDA